jgi:hypothetical protein
MKKQVNNLSYFETTSIYFSKILLIFRTRNTYGYNSVCMRIFQLIAGSRRLKRMRTPKVSLQY